MSEESAPPRKDEKKLTTEEVLAKLAADTYENREAINVMAKALVEINKKLEAKGGGGGAAGEDDAAVEILKRLFPESKGGSLEDLAKTAESMARVADALQHFRRPASPYSPADRFLMRAGARGVHRIMYEGVKRKSEQSESEPSDKEIDKMLGFEEEEEESEHVSE